MQIVQRHNKFFLQFDNGELELSEQQVQKRLSRGDKVLNQLQSIQSEIPDIESNVKITKSTQEKIAGFSSSSYASAKYFDYILKEFEQIYRANLDDEDALEKLKRFCINAVKKLERDRKSPKTDHVVIDYYLLSWSRVLEFLDTLPEKIRAGEQQATATQDNSSSSSPASAANREVKDHTKQLLIIQLMQAEGVFPINNALEGVTQSDVQKLISGVLGISKEAVDQAIHEASAILLKRDITAENVSARIQMLEEVEAHFEELPYVNIISRVKLLLKIYREKKLPSNNKDSR